jgi:calcineurin-like phosphoesterase family protein
MPNVFFIGDTHFSHKKIMEFEAEARPFSSVQEHDEALIERWNKAVTKKDTVWHLGDVLFSGHAFDLLSRLNGTKHLVLGNHDSAYPVARFTEHFNKIVSCTKFDGALLSHVPIHPDQFFRWKANIHGHLHSKRVLRSPHHPDERYVNVSAEHNNLTPISYEDLRRKHPILREPANESR